MKKLMSIFAILFLGACLGLMAQDKTGGSGDDFFNDASVEAPDKAKETTKVDEAVDKESVSLTGNLEAMGNYTMTRDFVFGNKDIDDNSLNYLMTGDLLLDVRLRKNFKAFLDLNIGYSNIGLPVVTQYTLMGPVSILVPGAMPPTGTILPNTLFLFTQNQTMAIGVREIFVDFNIDNVVYFRVGKQVLQWGVGYIWNPTDLVNIQQKNFLNLTALRDGAFGMRFDVVFSRNFHFYSFFQFLDAADFSTVGVAGKLEVLIGSTEMSLAAWDKGGKIPVFGFDITTPLFWNLDLRAEASISWGDNQDKLDSAGIPYSIRDQLVPRISVGLSRSFNVGDVENRLTIDGEFYYNYAGYDVNMFETLSPANLATFVSGYFSPNNYGQFYGALFITINRFLVSNLTLNLSGIGNFSDLSFMAVVDFSYQPVYNCTLDFKLISYLGANLREYTVAINPSNLTGTPGNNMFGAGVSCTVNF